MTKPITQILAGFGSLHPHEKPVVGGFTKAYRQLHPNDAKPLGEVIQALAQDRTLGRHGNHDAILRTAGVAPGLRPLMDRVVDAYEVDDLTTSLQKRLGTDNDRPPPELTRRDVLSAAFDNEVISQHIHGEKL